MISIGFNNVYINNYFAIVGPNKNLNLTNINKRMKDYYFDEKSFEKSQIKRTKEVIDNLLTDKTNLIVGGDLSNQLTASTFSLNNINISTINLYSACATFIESLIVASIFIKSENVNEAIVYTSSHNLASERQFRYPVEYGVVRNENSTYTITGSVGCSISNNKSRIKIKNCTIGYPVDLDINDPNYIGAVMAPSAGDVIYNHLKNNNEKPKDYDLILTGDLGSVGHKILSDYLKDEYNLILNNLIDAGENIYKTLCEINDGASGPAVLPLYFFYNILNKRKYKKILLVGTGALHSKSLVNQKCSIPGIAHAISIEVRS